MSRYYLPPAGGRPDRLPATLPSRMLGTDLSGEDGGWAGEVGGRPPRSVGALLRRRWASLVLGFAFVVGIVAALSFTLPRRYESSASFLIEETQPGSKAVAALATLERLGQSQGTETEVAIIRSHSVIEPVVDALDLNVDARVDGRAVVPVQRALPGLRATAAAQPGTYVVRPVGQGDYVISREGDTRPPLRARAGAGMSVGGLAFRLPASAGAAAIELRVRPFGRVVEDVQKRIDVAAAAAKSDVIRLRCDGRTALDAQRLCSAISGSYLQLRSTLQRAEASAAATFLTEQVRTVGAQLAQAEDRLRGYQQANGTVALETQAQQEVGRFVALKAQRQELAAERDALHSLVSTVEAGAARDYRRLASFPGFMKSQNQMVSQLLETLVQLENRRSDLATRRSERNADVAALDARIGEIQQQLHTLTSTYEQGLDAEIASLDGSLAKAGSELVTIPGEQVESARLIRQVALLEELYRFLQTRLHEAELARAVDLPSVRVVDAATLPFRPAFPNVPLNLGLGAVLGLAFGVLLALYREHADTRIYERAEVERATGVPVLGMIARLQSPQRAVALEPAPSGARALMRRRGEAADSEIAREAFRTLAAELRFLRAQDSGKPRTVAITSSSRGEGKTLTASNLAVAWASFPTRTLLIDADLRAAAVGRLFRLPARGPGLSSVLSGAVRPEDAVHLVQLGRGVSLHVLAAGPFSEAPAEVLDTEAFDELLAWGRARFDLVIVDTPPLNVLTDSASVAARVDSVLVVVRAGATDRAALDLTLARLGRAGGHVEGIVLNDINLPDHYVRYSRMAV